MSDKVERVARAIAKCNGYHDPGVLGQCPQKIGDPPDMWVPLWVFFVPMAHAAIDAMAEPIAREPNDRPVVAGDRWRS
jgi:hypothetical protein